jgi:SAM-dependent methyltransferase
MLKVTSDADHIYSGYAGSRPNYRAPTQATELLARREPVFRKHFLPLLPAERGARILDLGCGYGEFLYFQQRLGYTNASGVDLNDEQLGIGRSLGVRNLERGDAGVVLAGSREEFDFISAIDFLEHVPKNQVLGLLEQVYSALRPGGRFVCQVPNLAAFYSPLFYMDFSHETAFTAPSLKQALQLAHFDNIHVLPIGPVAHGVKSTVRVILWKSIAACLRLVQTIEGGPQDELCSLYTAAIFASADKSRQG